MPSGGGRSTRVERVGPRCAALCAGALLATACVSTVRLPDGPGDAVRRERLVSLKTTVDAMVAAGRSRARLGAARERAAALGLSSYSRTEWIDWFSAQRNLLIELPGRSERVIYLVAHYDKTDMNPLKLGSLLVNDALDELVSFTYLTQGAVDNATGVAVVLEVASELARTERRYTYRILLSGSEEAGIRGTRAHVARLTPEQKQAIELAINVDTVGTVFSPNCVTKGVSDPNEVGRALRVAQRLGFELKAKSMPPGTDTDVSPLKQSSFGQDLLRGISFNLVGGLLPQRSWFTASHSARVLNFSACDPLGFGDYVGATILLPLGRLHGPRDHAGQVDLERLYQQYAIVRELLAEVEGAP